MGKTITFFDLSKRKYRIPDRRRCPRPLPTTSPAVPPRWRPKRMPTPTSSCLFVHRRATSDSSAPTTTAPGSRSSPLTRSRSVVLQREAGGMWSTVWQGYITPQVYDNEYPGKGTVVHTMPIQCPLSVLTPSTSTATPASARGRR